MLPHASSAPVEQSPRRLDVPSYLLLELVYAFKPHLRSQKFLKRYIYDLPIQVSLEVEEVRLNLALPPVEGRCGPDVGTRRVTFAADNHMPDVDPSAGRERARVREDVGCREPDSLPSLVPLYDLAA